MDRRRFLAGTAALVASFDLYPASKGPVALVLGGGGCRGYGHVGVLRGLEKHGFKPDLVVGASVGALVGGLYASGMSAAQLERVGAGASDNMLRGWVFPGLGMFSGERIRRFVEKQVGERRIESLPMRFAAIATDLRTGKMRVFDRGDLGRAVQASASAPGLVEPVKIDGGLYAEAALSAPVPVDAARALGAARVLAIDVSFPPEQANLEDPIDALYQGFSILTRRLALEERARADLSLEPPIPQHSDMKPATLQAITAAGEQAVDAALPKLRALFG